MKFLFGKNIFDLGKFLIVILFVFFVFYFKSPAVVDTRLKILLPLYIYPNWYEPESYVWSNVARAAQQVPMVVIINPNNGPDDNPPNEDYQRGLQDLRESEMMILGYVYTQYGDRPMVEVKRDIDLYRNYYNVDGIFLDESASNTQQLNYYREIYQYIKTKTDFKVVTNPGTHTDESYLTRPATDTSVIFEDSSPAWLQYKPQAYVSRYKNEHFASLIHSVPDAATMKHYLDRAIAFNIGYIYITDDSPSSEDGDPWNSLPSYWQEEINYIQFLNQIDRK